MTTDFAGRRGRLFWLALKTSVLTVLTLGLYRFWMKTRLRRYYWSSIRPGGVPLEYVGEPMEKLLGFLIAVVILAFYIGIVNLILMFLSFSVMGNNFAAYAISLIGVIPLWFYAQYRARRYVLARTRWRGLRFGLEPGAWGYAWRAVLHWALTLLTLGLLWPRKTFWLEKYRTDRTCFGDRQLSQGGSWGMLFPAFIPLALGVLISAPGILIGAYAGPVALYAVVPGLLLTFYGWVNYRVQSFRLLTSHKSAGQIGLVAQPRSWRVLRIYGVGGLLILLALGGLAIGLVFAVALLLVGTLGGAEDMQALMNLAESQPTWLTALITVGLYFSFFIFWGVLTQTFLTLPLICHFAETLQITGAPYLAGIRQRGRDEFTEAEGFAEALDVGAAI